MKSIARNGLIMLATATALASSAPVEAQIPQVQDGLYIAEQGFFVVRVENGFPDPLSIFGDIFRTQFTTFQSFSGPQGSVSVSIDETPDQIVFSISVSSDQVNGSATLSATVDSRTSNAEFYEDTVTFTTRSQINGEPEEVESTTTTRRYTPISATSMTLLISTGTDSGAEVILNLASNGGGASQSDPILPVSTDGSPINWQEAVDIALQFFDPNDPIWLDPPYASGFRYELDPAKNDPTLRFSGAELPTGFGNSMEVWAAPEEGAPMQRLATQGAGRVDIAGVLDNDGVTVFEVRGLSPLADLESEIPFPVGVLFTGGFRSTATVTVSPLGVVDDPINTPTPTVTPTPTPVGTPDTTPSSDSAVVLSNLNATNWEPVTVAGVFDAPGLNSDGSGLTLTVEGGSTNTFGSWATTELLDPIPAGLYELEIDITTIGSMGTNRVPDLRVRVLDETALSQNFVSEAALLGQPLPATVRVPFRSKGTPWRIAIDLLSFTPEQTGGFEITGIRLIEP